MGFTQGCVSYEINFWQLVNTEECENFCRVYDIFIAKDIAP